MNTLLCQGDQTLIRIPKRVRKSGRIVYDSGDKMFEFFLLRCAPREQQIGFDRNTFAMMLRFVASADLRDIQFLLESVKVIDCVVVL